jgi:threonine aldolase
LKGDTFTKPNKKMFDAMSIAEVGDAVYDEDPTTNSELLRKEKLLVFFFFNLPLI